MVGSDVSSSSQSDAHFSDSMSERSYSSAGRRKRSAALKQRNSDQDINELYGITNEVSPERKQIEPPKPKPSKKDNHSNPTVHTYLEEAFKTVDDDCGDIEMILSAGDRSLRVMFDHISDGIDQGNFAELPSVREHEPQTENTREFMETQWGDSPITFANDFFQQLGNRIISHQCIHQTDATTIRTPRGSLNADQTSILVSNYSKVHRWCIDSKQHIEGFLERACPNQPLCLVQLQSGLALEADILRIFEEQLLAHVSKFVPAIQDLPLTPKNQPLPRFLGGDNLLDVSCTNDPVTIARPLEAAINAAVTATTSFNERIFFSLSCVFNLYLKVARHRYTQLYEKKSEIASFGISTGEDVLLVMCKGLANDCVAVATLCEGYRSWAQTHAGAAGESVLDSFASAYYSVARNTISLISHSFRRKYKNEMKAAGQSLFTSQSGNIADTSLHKICMFAGEFDAYHKMGGLPWVCECLSGSLLAEIIRWYLYCLLTQLPGNAVECLMRDEVVIVQGFALTYPQVCDNVAVLLDIRTFLEERSVVALPDLFAEMKGRYANVNAGVGKRLLRMRSDISKEEKVNLIRHFRRAQTPPLNLTDSPGPQPFEKVVQSMTPVRQRVHNYFKSKAKQLPTFIQQ